MKLSNRLLCGVVVMTLISTVGAFGDTPTYKMTTPIPEAIKTPDAVDTRIGELRFFDGIPDDATTEKVYDHLDFMRGVDAFLNATAADRWLAQTQLCSAKQPNTPDG